MTTTSQRLTTLSGLSGVSAAEHLKAIKQSGATAGQMLVSRSSLSVASAIQHLMDEGGVVTAAVSDILIFMRRRLRR